MPQLTRRTTIVAVVFALAAGACSTAKPGAVATAPPASSPAASTAPPATTSASPSATPSPTATAEGTNGNQAEAVMLRTSDVGKGWKGEAPYLLRPPGSKSADQEKFCDSKSLPSDNRRIYVIFAIYENEDVADVRHDLTVYRSDNAAKAFSELDRALKTCKPVKLDDGSTWRLRRVGPGRAAITISLAGYKDTHVAFRAVRRADCLSVIAVTGNSRDRVDQLAKRLEGVVSRKMAKEGIR